jgi:hypothetical protein
MLDGGSARSGVDSASGYPSWLSPSRGIRSLSRPVVSKSGRNSAIYLPKKVSYDKYLWKKKSARKIILCPQA